MALSLIFEPEPIHTPLSRSRSASPSKECSLSSTTLVDSTTSSTLASPTLFKPRKGDDFVFKLHVAGSTNAFKDDIQPAESQPDRLPALCERLQQSLSATRKQLSQATYAVTIASGTERALEATIIDLQGQLRISAEENVGVLRFYEDACKRARLAQEREKRVLEENNSLRRQIENSRVEELTMHLTNAHSEILHLRELVYGSPDRAGFSTVMPDLQEQLCTLAEDNEIKHGRIVELESQIHMLRSQPHNGGYCGLWNEIYTKPVAELHGDNIPPLRVRKSSGSGPTSRTAEVSSPVSTKSAGSLSAPTGHTKADRSSPRLPAKKPSATSLPAGADGLSTHRSRPSHAYHRMLSELAVCPPPRPLTPMPKVPCSRVQLNTYKRLPRPDSKPQRDVFVRTRRMLPESIPARIVATLS